MFDGPTGQTDVNGGGPHTAAAFTADVDGGRMDGFIQEAERAAGGASCAKDANPELLAEPAPDVVGYHDGRDIPNYWALRQAFRPAGPHVRTERVVEPARAPAHGFGVVRVVRDPTRPGDLQLPQPDARRGYAALLAHDWTDLTDLLQRRTSRGGTSSIGAHQPNCADGDMCPRRRAASAPECPASGTRCRRSTPSTKTARPATSSWSPTCSPMPRPGGCRPSRLRSPTAPTANTPPAGSAPARPM
jgi:hypothetical protein